MTSIQFSATPPILISRCRMAKEKKKVRKEKKKLVALLSCDDKLEEEHFLD